MNSTLRSYLFLFMRIKNLIKRFLGRGHNKWFLLFFVSFLFFFLEIIFFSGLRFGTSYFRAQLIIAISLLSLTISGLLATLIPERLIQLAIKTGGFSLAITPLIGFAGILLAPIQFGGGATLLGLSFLPYGFLIGLLYRVLLEPAKVYMIELLGGAAGLVSAFLILPIIREENSLFLASLVAALVCVPFYQDWFKTNLKKYAAVIMTVLLGLNFVAHLHYDYFNLAVITPCRWPENTPTNIKAFPKITCQKIFFKSYEVIRSFGSTVDRIDIVKSNLGIMHTAFSGDGTDSIKPFPAKPYFRIDARLPSGILENPKTLIIGTAAEGVVKIVKAATNAKNIISLDLNPAITNLWKYDQAINQYAHHPFADVTLLTEDGRTFLETNKDNFDLITMMNTHRARDMGAFGEPDFLHTKEAFRLIWERLSSDGVLSFEEKNISPVAQTAILRIVTTVITSLKEAGVDPRAHIVAYEWTGAYPKIRPPGISQNTPQISKSKVPFVQFLVKKSPWTKEEITRLLEWAKEASELDALILPNNNVFLRWLWLPHATENISSENNYILIPLEKNPNAGSLILTDDTPFPIKFSEIAQNDFLYFSGIFGAITTLILIWWYLRARRRLEGQLQTKRQFIQHASFILPFYFIIIGFGYMTIEILYIQWLQFYLGSVTIGILTALVGLLSASALSGWWIQKSRIFHPTLILFPAILIISTLAIRELIFYSFVYSFALRVLIGTSFALVTGMLLGPFFPLGMAIVKKLFPGEEPLFVGLNGGALAMMVPASFYISSLMGIFSLAWIAVILYSTATLSIFLLHKKDGRV